MAGQLPPFGPGSVEQPTDPFSNEVSEALDEARGVLAEVGLRPYRVFIVTDKWTGPGHREGVLEDRELEELTPTPKRRPVSLAIAALLGGASQEGDLILEKISRVKYTEKKLRLRTEDGDEFPRHWDTYYAIQPIGQAHAEFYNVASLPNLSPTSWSVRLTARNDRGPLVIGPDLP